MDRNDLNIFYWENRYKNKETGWDIGEISKPLKVYFDQLTNKNLRILLPGCGKAYEVEYLYNNGFHQVFASDISLTAKHDFFQRVPHFPEDNWIVEDFFSIQQKFDLIIEQTFFCALHPSQRIDYVKKIHELLKPNGKLVGLLFNIPLNTDHPPFGGDKREYKSLFKNYFEIIKMDTAFNSIEPRKGNELFINLKKISA